MYQALTSKILLKLVPHAADVALTDDTAGNYARTCFNLLLDKHFLPSLDIACKLLFLRVSDIITGERSKGRTYASAVMISTLRVVEESLKKCNPKTIFQVFSTEETLLAFSRAYFFFVDLQDKREEDLECIKLIRNTLWESLFDPNHHIDGFRSIVQLRCIPTLIVSKSVLHAQDEENAKAAPLEHLTFHCYQESLVDLLPSLLAPDFGQEDSEGRQFSHAKIIVASRLLPLLFEGFLENARKYDEANERTAKRKNKSGVDVAQMQLFFFATVVSSLWGLAHQNLKVKNEIFHCCLRSVSLCSSLLLRHDSFVPSDDQKQLTRHTVLEALLKGVLEKTWSDSIGSQHASSIIEALMSLDHRLLRGKVEAVVLFCAEQHAMEDEGSNRSPVTKLLLALIDSHRKLRQINLVFSAILGVTTKWHRGGDYKGLSGLRALISRPCLQRALACASKDSPILEIQGMFSTVGDWIVQTSKTRSNTESGDMALALVIQHVVNGLLGCVRVDKSSAPSIATCCGTLMKNSVPALLGEGKVESAANLQRKKLGIALWAWILHLQMKCAFWLGLQYIQLSENEMPPTHSIGSLLAAAVAQHNNDQFSNQDKRELTDGLILLASYRLRQLDYFVHEPSLREPTGLSPRVKYQQEALLLAELMAESADESEVATSRWYCMAQFITSWVHYSSKEKLGSFLRWMFSRLSDAAVHQRGSVLVYPGGHRLPLTVYDKERAVALSLIKDASFHELQEMSNLLSPCALSTATLLVQEALKIWRQVKIPPCRELCPVAADNFTISSPKQFVDSLGSKTFFYQCNTEVPDAALKLLQGALRVVKSLNGLPLHRNPSVSLKCADAALRLEAFCRQLRTTDQNAILQDLICSLKYSAAKHLTLAGRYSIKLLPSTPSALKAALDNIKETSARILDCTGIDSNPLSRRFIFTTEELVGAIIGCYLQSVSGDTLHSHIMESLVRKKKQTDTERIILLILNRLMLRPLCGNAQIHCRADQTTELVSILLEWVLVQSVYFKTSPTLCFHGCLFIGETCRLLSKAMDNCISAKLAATVRQLGSTFIPALLLENQSAPILNAALYMVSCYSLLEPPSDIREHLINNLVRLGREGPWLEGSICSLARELDGNSLHATLLKISQKVGDSTLSLRLFPVVFRELKSKKQVQLVSNFTEGILHKALEAFDFRSKRTNVRTSLSVVSELTIEKLLISIRERDLAIILAQVSRMLEKGIPDNVIHLTCCSVTTALVQHFPKQLYACAPSLVALLHAFLQHVLQGELDEMEVRDRSQQFTRLCELLLPHKEVYKKHIIFLLLEFVHGVEHDLCLIRKVCLMPSVFYLLDMLSKYEMQQLNSQMSTTAKTIFRAVYQIYHKVHAYKG